MEKRLTLIFASLFLCVGMALAQVTTSGVVVSADDGEPILGATIKVVGGKANAITDAKGAFTIQVPSHNARLEVSYVGMLTQTVKAKPGITIGLYTDNQNLDEVMVVAFGTEKKSAFTGSAAVVGSDKLSKRTTTNVSDALVGSVPGLQLRGSTGSPGSSGGSINIRGIASMYAGTDPLIIVDGAPYTASLTNIPQQDIESVSVLKDAASAALYGARGAAGVIIITTKKGSAHKAEITVDAKWGAVSRAIQDYDIITDPGEYYEAYYKQLYNYSFYGQGNDVATANAWANKTMLNQLKYNVYDLPEGQQLIGTDGKLNPNATLGRKYTVDGTTYYLQPDNWMDLSYKTALRQDYNMTVRGGTNASSYYMSLGYLDEEGMLPNSSYNRITARLKADYQATKWMKLGANIGYIHSNREADSNMSTSGNNTNVMYYATAMAPIYPTYVRIVDEAGNIVVKTDEYNHPAYDYGVNSYPTLTRPFLAPGNPMGSNHYNKATSLGDQLNGTFTADLNITSYLKANVTSTVILGLTQSSTYENPWYGPKVSVNGELAKSSSYGFRTNNIQSLTYFKEFGKHNVNVMAGHEYYRTHNKSLAAYARGGFSPDIQEINAFAKKYDSSSSSSNYNVEGFFGNARYDYSGKYFASASYRRDATSYFAKEHRWGDFWSVGGAWLVSKEAFMQSTQSWLDMLKLKLSYGQQGNDNIGSYCYVDLYTLSQVSDTQMSSTFSRMGNPEISWEKTANLNAGVEFSFLKGRISGNVDVYTKKTSDLLFWLSIPESAGSRGYYGNVGDIRNTGVEVSLTGTIIRKKNIDWSVSANISHNTTKILSLPASKVGDLGGFQESSTWYEVGQPLYNRFCIEYAGVDDKGVALYYMDSDLAGATNRPGAKRDATTTNPNEATKYCQGSILPKAFGGFSTNLRIYGFDISATFDYQLGGKVTDNRYASYMAPASSANDAGHNYHKDYVKSWSPENTESDIPRWQYGDQYAVFSSSTRFLTNASYLNFQSFTVGYTVPKKLLKGISGLRVYCSGENLGFWSARQGFDPRYSFSGNTSVATYSPSRIINGGIQLTF